MVGQKDVENRKKKAKVNRSQIRKLIKMFLGKLSLTPALLFRWRKSLPKGHKVLQLTPGLQRLIIIEIHFISSTATFECGGCSLFNIGLFMRCQRCFFMFIDLSRTCQSKGSKQTKKNYLHSNNNNKNGSNHTSKGLVISHTPSFLIHSIEIRTFFSKLEMY